jgi:hypothetical protein
MLKRSPNASSHRLNDDQISELAERFRLRCVPSRLSSGGSCLGAGVWVGVLAQREPVAEMAQRPKRPPPPVSQHQRLLRAARQLQAERQRRQVVDQTPDQHVARMQSDMGAHVAEEHDLEAP